MKILIIGKGYIGQRCAAAWSDAVVSDMLVQSVADAEALLAEHSPDVVLNAAGVVGKPNVDWCEDNQAETIFGNTVLPFYIAQACAAKDIYLLHIGSGCIFYGDSPDNRPWNEQDFANPQAVYTRAKYAADLVLSTMPNVGIGRIRMPIDWQKHRANLIDKLTAFPKVVDVENSLTVLDDMVDCFYQLLQKKASGVFHVVNPGSIKHRRIIELYEQIVDPSHKNEWISEAELVSQGLVKKTRSNNIMSSARLADLGIKMRPVEEAVADTLRKYRENL